MSNGRESSPEDRRDEILRVLHAQDQTSVSELSQRLGVSEVTVRKDLSQLEAQGLLTRVHGGAVASGLGRFELQFAERRQIHSEEKRKIAERAAAMVQSEQSIFLDASTTAFHIARLIKDRRQLTVITNGLYTALELTFAPGVDVIVVGGTMRHRSSSLVGALDLNLLRRWRVDIGFFGARGVTAQDGLTESDIQEAYLKQQMVAGARRVVGVVDSSKFGTVSLHAFALPHELDQVITDARLAPEIAEEFRNSAIMIDLV